MNDANGNESDALIRKLAGFQTVIPQFDNISAITPKFFIEHLENITDIAKCTKPERLLILKSRIRGDALTNVINSPDLNQEKDYDEFKRKFLSYFDTQYSLGARQKQFSNCRMIPNEQVKTYAAKVALATENFFNTPDLTNDAIKTIFENTKLAKFIDGLLPCYKQSVILKDPKTFQSAVEFVQMLQANEISSNDSPIMETVNAISKNTANSEIKSILEAHALNTQEMISALTKDVERLKLRTQNPPQVYNNHLFRTPYKRTSGYSRYNYQRSFPNRNIPTCSHCHSYSHSTFECFKNPTNRNNFRGRQVMFRRNGRVSHSSQNYVRGQRPPLSQDYRPVKSHSENC